MCGKKEEVTVSTRVIFVKLPKVHSDDTSKDYKLGYNMSDKINEEIEDLEGYGYNVTAVTTTPVNLPDEGYELNGYIQVTIVYEGKVEE